MSKTQKILVGVIVVLAIALGGVLYMNQEPDNKETNKISGPIGMPQIN